MTTDQLIEKAIASSHDCGADAAFAAREEIRKLRREIADLKSFIKGVGINCERITQ